MKILRRLFITMLASTALAGAALAADANVAGEWDFTVETQAGTGSPHFSLKQDGTAVTGTYKGQLGEAPVTGTVKGNELTLNFKVNAQGAELAITYSGTWSEERYRRYEQKLRDAISGSEYRISGDAQWARYDPPSGLGSCAATKC